MVVEPWPDTLIIQIPLIDSTYYYIVPVQNDNQFGMYYKWEQERDARNQVLKSLLPVHKDDVFIDIGAHIGSWTVAMAAIRPKMVYAIEPSKLHSNHIATLVQANCIYTRSNTMGECVKIVNIALGDSNTKMSLSDLQTGVGFDYIHNHMATVDEVFKKDIDIVRFDDFIQKEGIDAKDVKFIKIDVEGGEYGVLNGMINFLMKHQPDLLIECHHIDNLFSDTVILTGLSRFGYKIKKRYQNLYWFSTSIK